MNHHDNVFTVDHVDYATPKEAIDVVEAKGHGSVIEFMLERNREGCLPDYVHRSLNLWSFQDGEWWSHYIYSGTGEKIAREKPH